MRTYGTAFFDESARTWCISAEPHVVVRLKRVFPKISSYSKGILRLSATPENARDLEWFSERYPLEIGNPDLLRRQADQHREKQALVQQLLNSQVVPSDFKLALPPREYQAIAASMLLATGSLLLADDVGLGKTVSAIACMADQRTLPCLYVTLTHLPPQVRDMINLFAPHLGVAILKQGTPYDLTKRGRTRFPDVIITNYHKLSGWSETLAPLVKMVVFDECQELRRQGSHGGKSLKYAAAEEVARNAAFRLGMSATPIYNYGGEMFNVLNVIAPDALGSSSEFYTEWCTWGDSDKASIIDPKAFGSHLRESGLMLRRTRKDVGRVLPPVTIVPHHVESDPAALERVTKSCAELARLILGRSEEWRGQKMQAAEELSNTLRQATGIAKAPYVAEFVKLLVDSGEQVVLYGWHREVYSVWMDLLKECAPVMYTGSESVPQKEAAKKAFIDGEAKVLMISLRSGAGLDGLQGHCNTVVFGELDWSPGVHEQCIGRVHRDGQDDPVTAYFLVADSGSDPIVSDVLGLKRAQIEGLRDPEGDLVETLQGTGGHIRKLAERYLEAHVLPKGLFAEGARA